MNQKKLDLRLDEQVQRFVFEEDESIEQAISMVYTLILIEPL